MVSYMGWGGGGGGCTRTGVQLWVEFHEGAINHILTQSIQLSLSGVCVCVCVQGSRVRPNFSRVRLKKF